MPSGRVSRLVHFDYATPAAYSVTICVWKKETILPQVAPDRLRLTEAGHIVGEGWSELLRHYPNVGLDAFVVMPNHVHGIIVLEDVGAGFKPAPTVPAGRPPRRHAIPEIVRAFKTFSARRIKELRMSPGRRVWQSGYYDHIVRNDEDLDRIRVYISSNPLRWSMDREIPRQTVADPFDAWLSGNGEKRVPRMRS
jgi:REP element-mobilizing transposase RayT